MAQPLLSTPPAFRDGFGKNYEENLPCHGVLLWPLQQLKTLRAVCLGLCSFGPQVSGEPPRVEDSYSEWAHPGDGSFLFWGCFIFWLLLKTSSTQQHIQRELELCLRFYQILPGNFKASRPRPVPQHPPGSAPESRVQDVLCVSGGASLSLFP